MMNIHQIASKIEKEGHSYSMKSDREGTYALETDNYIVTSKKYIFKNLASVQKGVLLECEQKDKTLVIYFQQEGAFYKFEPAECVQYAYENDTFNQRADLDEEYADFPIKYGERTYINGSPEAPVE